MTKFETPNGKELTIIPVGNHLKIQFTSGGELPEELSGFFTEYRYAEQAINRYLESKKTKKNGTSSIREAD